MANGTPNTDVLPKAFGVEDKLENADCAGCGEVAVTKGWGEADKACPKLELSAVTGLSDDDGWWAVKSS